MNEILLIIIAILLFVLVAVFAYNMLQEKHYRNKIRNQFGHADRDALLGSQTQSVRDGQSFSHDKVSVRPAKLKLSLAGKRTPAEAAADDPVLPETYAPTEIHKETTVLSVPQDTAPVRVEPEVPEAVADTPQAPAQETSLVGEIRATFARMLGSETPPLTEPPAGDTATDKPQPEEKYEEEFEEYEEYEEPAAADTPREVLIPLMDLRAGRLPWFDERADYMAYISLREPLELPALPHFSKRYRYQIVGCTMDGRFQLAEPVPGVLYQAFAVGLQAISRKGLADTRELDAFGRQIRDFSDSMDAECWLEDTASFLSKAAPLDELCARVDQTIAIHLVSRISILGIELRSTLEDLGFQLMEDGTFGFADVGGEVKYSVVTLDGSRFTSSLLSSQPYKGFSMLFDITRVPHGEGNFDEFMNLAVRLSSLLNLELVDDQIQQLSTEWMKEVRTYVLGTQKEMLDADIVPGGSLAQRLFA